MSNGIGLEALFCPITGRLKLLNTLPDSQGLLSGGLDSNGEKCFTAATLAQGKIWQGDSTNSPAEANLNDLVLNLPMKVWTTATRPSSPSGTLLGLNIKYR